MTLHEDIINKIGFDPLDRESCLAAVRRDGYNIRYIRDPDKEVQLEAVKQRGYYIRYIQNPDKEVQLAAIESSGYDLRVIATCHDWKEMEEEIETCRIIKDIIE